MGKTLSKNVKKNIIGRENSMNVLGSIKQTRICGISIGYKRKSRITDEATL